MNELQDNLEMNVEAHDVEIDFGRIIKRLWHFAWLIALLAVIGAVAMYGFSKYILSPEYQSTASLYIHDKNVTTSAGGEIISGEDGTIEYNTIGGNAADYLKNTYTRTLTSNTTLNIVIKNLDLGMETKDLREMISYNIEQYPYLDITVTSNDPSQAARIANELANVLYEQVAEIVGGSSLTHVDEAVPPTEKSGPNTMMNVIIGFAAGFAITCMTIVVIELANNKIYNDEYLINTYGIPVLASITDSDALTHKGYGYYKKYGKYEYKSNHTGGSKKL